MKTASMVLLMSSLFLPSENPCFAEENTAVQCDARLTPVSMGDAIIEPFWDRTMSVWSRWTIEDNATGADAEKNWCKVLIRWNAGAAGEGPVLCRRYAGSGVELGPYTQLVLSAGFPEGTSISITARTDKGEATGRFSPSVSRTTQHILDLPAGSVRLGEIRIALGAKGPGRWSGNLLWLGVRNPAEKAAEEQKWKQFTTQPLDAFLLEEPDPADLAPLYNLLCPAETFRKACEEAAASGEAKQLELRAAVQHSPHLGGANQNLFCREEDVEVDRIWGTLIDAKGKSMGLLDAAQKAAIAGDRNSLREVAKAAVQIALIPHWDSDFLSEFPGSAWEQRPFAQAQACYAIAVAFDLAGAWLSPAGRNLLLRRLGEDGIGSINYAVWRWQYIFECNQLSVFSMGRLGSYSILEKQKDWGHVTPYTDLAFRELEESLGKIFLPDGTFPEGPGYLCYALSYALPSLSIYANARGRNMEELLPEVLSRTDSYIEALRSTEAPDSLIPMEDAQARHYFYTVPLSILSVLAKMRPGGAAARMFATRGKPSFGSLALWAQPAPDLSGADPEFYETFVTVPEGGFASSCRKLGPHLVKLVVVGGSANAGHNHQDRGSFVLEFAGETFAAEPGGMIYAISPYVMPFAQSHNMLVPATPEKGDLPAALNPPPQAVIPQAKGDDESFTASFDPGILWPRHYRSWNRRFDSPTPGELKITDSYELLSGNAVEFLWHTPLPVSQSDGRVVIQGTRGRAVITPPEGCEVEIIPQRDLGCRKLSTIVFRKKDAKGTLLTSVHLEAGDDKAR